MKVFIAFDGDHIGRMVGRASLADKPEEVARISQSIERGNRIWQSWAESHGGQVINIGGDEGRLIVEAEYLTELPKIRDQYAEAVGSTVSVGVGMKLSEADKSLMAAKMQGGDRIQLYTEEVNALLEELQEKPEGEKLFEEYLDPETGLQKAQPVAMNQGQAAGFSGASRSHPAAPTAPREASEHSEAEALRSELADAPQTAAGPDYEELFHRAASQTPEAAADKPQGLQDGVRAQVVKILQDVRAHAQELEQMQASNPDLYASVRNLVQAMIAMARGAAGDQQPQDAVQKSETRVGQCKWKLGERRCQRTVTGDYCHDHRGHWANKIARQEKEVKKSDKIEAEPSEDMPTGNELSKDLMPGGKGDDRPDTDFDADQLAAGIKREMEEHGLDEARAKEVAKDHLTEDPKYYGVKKAALEAGKTGRHQVVLPVGSQVDSGPSAAHEAGEIKVRDPETGKTKWRSVRAGLVMAPDGTPTSSRNPSGS